MGAGNPISACFTEKGSKLLYIKVKDIKENGTQILSRVSRFRTNDAMQRTYAFSTEDAAALLTQGYVYIDGSVYTMGHTLPAEEMAEATAPFIMDVEREDGTVSHLTAVHDARNDQ